MHLTFRDAVRKDLPRIVELLAADSLGAGRETTDLAPYEAAFALVDADPANELVVGVLDGRVVATMQLTFVPTVSRGGTLRMIVEAVRVDEALRGRGGGTQLMAEAHRRGRDRGARLAQLTSDKSRADAHRFYRRLGYAQSHEGFKLEL
ncbi:GNAT family N-acetyltransferase [Cellulomonas sp. HZM]|uniref:GNAT family N-acetyltransferase n=1 Tax=Cellulomonas sp. HZM TaxID=1454010 RepID=UPI0004936088|nr:GNAT family N-acetyltransferase [Cellulomonas sp. HZM]